MDSRLPRGRCFRADNISLETKSPINLGSKYTEQEKHTAQGSVILYPDMTLGTRSTNKRHQTGPGSKQLRETDSKAQRDPSMTEMEQKKQEKGRQGEIQVISNVNGYNRDFIF